MGPTSARRHLAALSALLVQVPSQESGYRLGNNCSAPCEPGGQKRLGETTLMLRAIVETILMVSVDLGGPGCDARAATPLARRKPRADIHWRGCPWPSLPPTAGR